MKDKIYQQAIYEVQEYCQNNKCTRADRFRILGSLTGIDEGTARIADRYLRAIRATIEPDKRCKELEREWQRSPALHNWQIEIEKEQKQMDLI